MESGSSTEQPQLHKETKKDFLYCGAGSQPPLWLRLGEECVKCEQSKWSVRNQHGRHLCSTSLQHLPMPSGSQGQASRLVKSNLVTVDVQQDPQRWLLEKCPYMFQIDLFSALFKSCSLHLDKRRPGFACCGAVALLNRSHFAKEEGAAPTLLLSCHLSPGVWENQKASPPNFLLFHSDTTEQNRISFDAVTGQALQDSYKGEFRCQSMEFPNAFPFLHLSFSSSYICVNF